MESHLRIAAHERQALLAQYRTGTNTRVRLRAHMLLLWTEGYSWAVIAGVLFCSTRTIARWQSRVELAGVRTVLQPSPPSGSCLGAWWSAVVVRWVLEWRPRDFGFVRSRWCCKVIVLLWREIYELQVSATTVRRWWHRAQLVWRRPRPVVGPTDPARATKRHSLRQLLPHCRPASSRYAKTRSISLPTPKSGPCGCAGAPTSNSPGPAPTRNTTWRARSTGGAARCS
jgi:transposase